MEMIVEQYEECTLEDFFGGAYKQGMVICIRQRSREWLFNSEAVKQRIAIYINSEAVKQRMAMYKNSEAVKQGMATNDEQ